MRFRALHQIVNRLAWGDAIGEQIRFLQRTFRERGWASEIYAGTTDDRSASEAHRARDYRGAADALVLVHHGFQTNLVPIIRRAAGEKLLVFHNITPSHFFAPFDQEAARACDAARAELAELATVCSSAVAFSEFSARELRALGMTDVRVVPFAVTPKAAVAEDAALAAELGDGRKNILFVGRAVPNKRVEDVLRVFAAYQKLYEPHSRLVIAGHVDRERAYGTWLFALRDALELEHVRILGRVSESELATCYRHARAYLSMSEHEGFGAPLVEAMLAGVPVVARRAAAVPDTLGDAGVLLEDDDPMKAARLLAALDREPELRADVIARQRARAEQFTEASARRAWEFLLR